MTGTRGRTGRFLGRAMRAPAALDRPGFRWALNALSPAPILVLVHRGRRSGKLYKTPVEALAENSEGGEIIISPMWGTNSDWYRNVLAGGLVEVHVRGEARRLDWRKLSQEEGREAIAAYRRDHPVYSRMILRMLASIHDLQGDPVEAVTRALPMLALRPATESPG